MTRTQTIIGSFQKVVKSTKNVKIRAVDPHSFFADSDPGDMIQET